MRKQKMSTKKIIVVLVGLSALFGMGFYFYPAERQQPVEPSRPHKVTVNWEKAARAVSYNIYRRPYRSDAYSKLGTSPVNTYEDPTAMSGETYCYQVTSVDSKGHESVRSKDLCVTVPRP
jgi:fibronectin type 3 domain-containing protein